MARFDIDATEVDRLVQVLQKYQGNTENAINDVLHNEAGQLIHDEIKLLMPVSGKTWKGKAPAAKTAKSLTIDTKQNLAVTVKTTKRYHYLWFPDDGSNTYLHVGKNGVPQEFFKRGGENKQSEIIDRCIQRLVDEFEK
jgi:hypothetical protein